MSTTTFFAEFPDDLISTAETAEDFEVTEATLAGWRSTGKGPDFYKIGRLVKYSRSGNARWKQQQLRSPRRAEATS
jgi:hypothetical protein